MNKTISVGDLLESLKDTDNGLPVYAALYTDNCFGVPDVFNIETIFETYAEKRSVKIDFVIKVKKVTKKNKKTVSVGNLKEWLDYEDRDLPMYAAFYTADFTEPVIFGIEMVVKTDDCVEIMINGKEDEK